MTTTYASNVIPDGAKRRSGTQLSAHAFVGGWVPALAALGRDDIVTNDNGN
jgi:hypothetical protein